MPVGKTRLNRTAQDRPGNRVHMYIDVELHQQIKNAASSSFRSVSAWIEEACKEKLERDRKENR